MLRRSVAAAVCTVVLAGSSLHAQSRTFVTLAAGFATQVDAGSTAQSSASAQAALLRRLGRRFAVGMEAGGHRYDVLDQRLTETEPSAMTRDWHRTNDAWHVGPVLRLLPAADTWMPYAEAGAGLYALREVSRFRASPSTPLDGENRDVVTTVLAPGLSLGAGVDYFPGNARVGLGLSARFRVAGRPYDDSIFGAGFLTLQAGVTVR